MFILYIELSTVLLKFYFRYISSNIIIVYSVIFNMYRIYHIVVCFNKIKLMQQSLHASARLPCINHFCMMR